MSRPRRRGASLWTPRVGGLAEYRSRHSTLARDGRPVRVVAEASGGRLCVEIIGHAGTPVRITVKSEHLRALPPGLFDEHPKGPA